MYSAISSSSLDKLAWNYFCLIRLADIVLLFDARLSPHSHLNLILMLKKTLNDSKHTFLVNFRVIPSDEPLTINISSNIINFLEHVQVRVTLNFTRRGDLEMNLTSPLGTTSRLIQHRPWDSLTSLNNWTILTLQHWGENPAGVWKLTQKNFRPQYKNTGLSV